MVERPRRVRPKTLSAANGYAAQVNMTWGEFNAMRVAVGLSRTFADRGPHSRAALAKAPGLPVQPPLDCREPGPAQSTERVGPGSTEGWTLYRCTDCGHEWQAKRVLICPQCSGGVKQ